MPQKKLLDIKVGVEIYKENKGYTDDEIAQLPGIETEGGIDTLFDTYYDPETESVMFGAGCASFDEETGTAYIEGAVVGDSIIVS